MPAKPHISPSESANSAQIRSSVGVLVPVTAGREQDDDAADDEPAPANPPDAERGSARHVEFLKKRPVMPCGIRRSRTIASASIAISPITGVEPNETIWLIGAEDHRARQRAGDDRGAAGDDGDERLGDVERPRRRQEAGERRHHAAGEARQRGAGGEGPHVDPLRVVAERRGDVGVLHRAARDQADARVAQDQPEDAASPGWRWR